MNFYSISDFSLLEEKFSIFNCLSDTAFRLRRSFFFLSDSVVYIVVNIAIFDIAEALDCDAIDILIENTDSTAVDNTADNTVDCIIE